MLGYVGCRGMLGTVKLSDGTHESKVKNEQKHFQKSKMTVRIIECFPNFLTRKVANEMNINREIVRQSVKEFLVSQPYKIKQCQKLTVANPKEEILQKWIAIIKRAADDQLIFHSRTGPQWIQQSNLAERYY